MKIIQILSKVVFGPKRSKIISKKLYLEDSILIGPILNDVVSLLEDASCALCRFVPRPGKLLLIYWLDMPSLILGVLN